MRSKIGLQIVAFVIMGAKEYDSKLTNQVRSMCKHL